MPSKPCTCSGNPNCFRCGGFGSIETSEESFEERAATRAYASQANAIAAEATNAAPAHRPKQAKNRPAAPKSAEPMAVVDIYKLFKRGRGYRCPQCGNVYLAPGVFTTHLRMCANIKGVEKPIRPAKKRAAKRQKPALSPKQCPHCGRQGRADKIRRHILYDHVLKGKPAPPQPPRAAAQARRAEVDRQLTDETIRRESREAREARPSIDATSEYSRAYRENGRFGSHPSHDSFDDESNAD